MDRILEISKAFCADTQVSSEVVRGTPDDIDEIRQLAQAMDVRAPVPPGAQVSTRVFALQFGDAAIVAEILRGNVGDGTTIPSL